MREEIVRAAVATVARRLGRNRREERGSREEWGRLEALGVVRNRTEVAAGWRRRLASSAWPLMAAGAGGEEGKEGEGGGAHAAVMRRG